jgi:hypothetical protein
MCSIVMVVSRERSYCHWATSGRVTHDCDGEEHDAQEGGDVELHLESSRLCCCLWLLIEFLSLKF